MTFMLFPLLPLLCLISIAIWAISLAVRIGEGSVGSKWCLFFSSLSTILLVVWIVGVTTRPWKVEKVEYLEVQRIKGSEGSIQAVFYTDSRGKLQILDVSYHRPEWRRLGTKIRHTLYADGPYCGCVMGGVDNDIQEKHRHKFELIGPEILTSK